MVVANDELTEGAEYTVEVYAKGARGEGIGRVGNVVVMIKDAKTRIGRQYNVRVTKIHRTFAYAEIDGGERLAQIVV